MLNIDNFRKSLLSVDERIQDILIVDDQLPNLRVLSLMLKHNDYKVRKATDGESAIEAVKIKQPDLILLDIQMPGMDGYEVCHKLKSNDETKDIPIIFISALSEVFDKVKAFDMGGVDYITKPFQEEEVLARINSQLTIRLQHKILQKEQKILMVNKTQLEFQQEKLKAEIEQRKEAEKIILQSRALIHSILTNSLDGIAAFESKRNIETGKIEDFESLEVNPIFRKMFNQKDEDSLNFKKTIDEIDSNLFSDFVKVIETDIPLEGELIYGEPKNKERKWYHYMAVKLGDGLAITFRDITIRKTAEIKLNRLATIDGLTGINNRRIFDETLHTEWQRCQREEISLSLIIFDVDFFKLYNDRYGHQAGDDCLRQVAQAAREAVKRPTDLVARYGGEEFAIVLPHTERLGAIFVAETIKEAIHSRAIPHEKSTVNEFISVSLGIASIIPTSESSPDTLIQMADRALYEAKQQGRDRYCYAG